MLFVSLCCIVYLFNFVFFLLFLSLADEIKLLNNNNLNRPLQYVGIAKDVNSSVALWLTANLLYPVYTIQPVEQPVEQPAASCKRGLTVTIHYWSHWSGNNVPSFNVLSVLRGRIPLWRRLCLSRHPLQYRTLDTLTAVLIGRLSHIHLPWNGEMSISFLAE